MGGGEAAQGARVQYEQIAGKAVFNMASKNVRETLRGTFVMKFEATEHSVV